MTRVFACFATAMLFLPGCASGGGSSGPGDDTTPDAGPDAQDDPASEAPGDAPWDPAADPPDDTSAESPPPDADDTAGEEDGPPRFSFCVQGCSAPAQCCTSGACGSYPARWECDGYCRNRGCLEDAECATWASGYSLPGAARYKCRAASGVFSSCVPGCSTPADCCAAGLDCSAYPLRYGCVDGGCVMDGCRDDGECSAYAAAYSLFRPDLYRCRGLGGYRFCAQSCAAPADCCPPERTPCAAYPYHYSCADGFCASLCSSTPECVAYAQGFSLPGAESYVCREW